MNTTTFATLGTAFLLLTGCGGSSSGSSSPGASASAPAAPPQVFLAGVLEQGAAGLSLNQRPLDVRGAQLTFDGQAAGPEVLQPGMPLSGTAKAEAGMLKLEKAEIRSEVRGPLDAVNHDAFQVVGRTVLVTAKTLLVDDQGGGKFQDIHVEDFHLRDDLTVFGTGRGGTLVEATRIERRGRGAETEVQVRGTVQGLDPAAAMFLLDGTRVGFGSAKVTGSLAEGVSVEVQGLLAGGAITASQVRVETPAQGGPQGEAELRGRLSNLDAAAKTFSLLAFTIDFSQASVLGSLANGEAVQVHATGIAGQPDRLTATIVKVEDAPAPAVGEQVTGALVSMDLPGHTLSLGISSFWWDGATTLQSKGMPMAFSDLKPGDLLEIHFDSSRRNAAGLPYAFRVQAEEAPSSAPANPSSAVEGLVGAFEAASRSFTLGGVTVQAGPATTYHRRKGADLTTAEFWSTNRNGAKAQAQGVQTGSTLLASRIELK